VPRINCQRPKSFGVNGEPAKVGTPFAFLARCHRASEIAVQGRPDWFVVYQLLPPTTN
jgi:hypothetical protein